MLSKGEQQTNVPTVTDLKEELSEDDPKKKYSKLLQYKDTEKCLRHLPTKKIKLLVIDLDRFVLNSEKFLSEKHLQAIQYAIYKQLRIIFLTNRPHQVIEKGNRAKSEVYKFWDYFSGIFQHGSYVTFLSHSHVLSQMSESNLTLIKYLGLSYELQKNMIFVTTTGYFMFNDKGDDSIEIEVGEDGEATFVEPSDEYFPVHKERRRKITVLHKYDDLFKLKHVVSVEIYDSILPDQTPFQLLKTVNAEMKKYFVTTMHLGVHRTHKSVYLFPKRSSYILALDYFLKKYQLTIKDVLTLGFTKAEIPLMLYSAYSITSSDALQAVKNAADCVGTWGGDIDLVRIITRIAE